MSKKQTNICRVSNYNVHSLVVISTIIVCVSISAFASLVAVPRRITSSALVLKVCVITAGINKYKSNIKKEMKKHDKIVMLTKLNSKKS